MQLRITVPHAKSAKDAKAMNLLVPGTRSLNDEVNLGKEITAFTPPFAPFADFA